MPPGPWVHQDFARTLYPTFKGRALWQASPPVRGWTCNDGLRVGDVYVLFGDNGMFWFNVSLPKDHERNLRAPKDHQPIHLEPDVDVITTRHSRHSLLGATNSANDPLKMSARLVLDNPSPLYLLLKNLSTLAAPTPIIIPSRLQPAKGDSLFYRLVALPMNARNPENKESPNIFKGMLCP